MSASLRLLDLPLELQHNVFRKAYEEHFVLYGSKNCGLSITWRGAPSVNLLLTCRRVYYEALPIYRQSFTSLDVTELEEDRLERWLCIPGRQWLLPQIKTLAYAPDDDIWRFDLTNCKNPLKGLRLECLKLEWANPSIVLNEADYRQVPISLDRAEEMYRSARDEMQNLDITASKLEVVLLSELSRDISSELYSFVVSSTLRRHGNLLTCQ